MATAADRDHLELCPPGEGSLADVGAVTDRGIRHHRNEDAAEIRTGADGQPWVLAVVSDGVSSSLDPHRASAAAVDEIAARLEDGLRDLTAPPSPDALAELVGGAVVAGAASVAALAPEGSRAETAPACTIVTAAIAGGVVVIGWLGDSRAYWVPSAGSAVPMTVDDSWAAEAIAAGADARTAYNLPQAHAITAWLGHEAPLAEPHLVALAPALVDAGGVLLLCSDGFWNYLTDEAVLADVVRGEAGAALADGDASAVGLARRLTAWAVAAGGDDNITVAVVPAAAIVATAGRS